MIIEVFAAIIHKEEDVYVARCPEVVTDSQGKSVESAISNLKEATELYLEEFPCLRTAYQLPPPLKLIMLRLPRISE